MTLLSAFLDIVEDWRDVFPQRRTWNRVVRQPSSRWFASAAVR